MCAVVSIPFDSLWLYGLCCFTCDGLCIDVTVKFCVKYKSLFVWKVKLTEFFKKNKKKL